MIYSEVVLLVKAYNEQDFRDWVIHYNSFNFDKITIMNNESSFNLNETIEDINKGNISINNVFGYPNQNKFYSDYCKNSNSRWVFFVDDDEFLYFDNNTGINNLLANYEQCSGLSVNWKMIGYNKDIEDRISKSCIDYCTYTLDKNINDTHVKTFVNPKKVLNYGDPHLPVFNEGKSVDFNYNIVSKPINGNINDNIRLYHYYVKSEEDWNIKINRGRADINIKKTETYNQVNIGYNNEDLTLKKYKEDYWELK